VRIEDAETDGRAVSVAAAAVAGWRTCCVKLPVETPSRSAPAQEYTPRNDTLITAAAVLRHRTVTSSAGTRSPSPTSDAGVRQPGRRRGASAAAAPDGELLPVAVGR